MNRDQYPEDKQEVMLKVVIRRGHDDNDDHHNMEQKKRGTTNADDGIVPHSNAMGDEPSTAFNTPNGSSNTTDQPEAASGGSDLSALEAQKETPTRDANDADEVHSAFGKHEKRFIVVMVTLASFFSPLSGQIYYPVMPTLVESYHLTTALVNLTITTYMILQGLAPSFMGTFADTGGRRPAYILAFTIYTAANIGLALQDSFAALLVLRCIQSAGSSGTVSFGYGVIADIATPAERGQYIGPMAAGIMVAPAMGPVVGGLLARFLGWRSVFWFLVIISGGYLILFMVAMPETARKIVGNGSVAPREWWRMSLLQYWMARRRRRNLKSDYNEQTGREGRRSASPARPRRTTKLSFPNPLTSVAVLLEKDALIIISFVGLVMFSNIALLTSTPNLFGKLYGFNDLQIGLCFIPLGASACIGAVLNGKVIDYNYRRTARKLGVPVDRKKGDDLRAYPIEHTRLQTVFPVMAVGVATFIPYGWVLQQRAPLAAPLALQFIIGFCFIASLNTLNTLLVDLFPDRPATAAAACNLVRCWLGAVGAAVIDHMLRGMGWGWCFAFLGLLMALAMGLLWVESLWGMQWREKRVARMEHREKEKMEKARTAGDVRANGKSPDDGCVSVVHAGTDRRAAEDRT
ncbi:hypothetical protein NUU61_003903 [Penicillium alfredii]|uniref:Major facilitator superfamily (MFS) profile domain-containing protein n=1 Tax=Penicillium alfredii TaxID=1506179 RepID=A0A9W9FK49_9EURO|nr:uncharacterized protein NUU61_003903 [Penicillium alfredii]KAJ5101681.1 hypothetical protein NUU61_003903 [Penicillium alfredii]